MAVFSASLSKAVEETVLRPAAGLSGSPAKFVTLPSVALPDS